MAATSANLGRGASVLSALIRGAAVGGAWLFVANVVFPGQCYSWDLPLGVVNRTLFGTCYGWLGIIIGTSVGAALVASKSESISSLATIPLAIAAIGSCTTTVDAVIGQFNRVHLVESITRYGAASLLLTIVLGVSLTRWSASVPWVANRIVHAGVLVCAATVAAAAALAGAEVVGSGMGIQLTQSGIWIGIGKLTMRDWAFVMSAALFALAPPIRDSSSER